MPDEGVGVDRVTTIEWAHGCWTESPEAPWWGGFRPEPASADWREAAFVDLQPLFERVREMYFTTAENYRKTRDAGLDPKQWPYAFATDPSWKPPIVKVIDVAEPTAVIASMSGGEKARAFVASLDGTVGVYRVGGLATDAPSAAGDIKRVGEVPLCPVAVALNPAIVV